MRECEVCGNDYDKPLEIVIQGESHFFDCFECAIHALHRGASTATARSSVTGLKLTVRSTVALIAPANRA